MKSEVASLARAWDQLHDVHATYINKISSQGMALSLETAALTWALCDVVQPKSILDLGSGFSSYVIRTWARTNNQAEVWSVDDDSHWLERSRRFCKQHEVETDNFEVWSTFKDSERKFDLVIYDLGRMQVRSENLKQGLRFTKPNGVCIVDDMHKFNYQKEVVAALADLGLEGFDMKQWTTDPHEGRHCWLAAKPGSFDLNKLRLTVDQVSSWEA